MFDLISQSDMIQSMDKSMSLATRRMALIAANMANLDTPGYRSQDIPFQAALKEALDQQDGQSTTSALHLAQTHPAHFGLSNDTSAMALQSSLRPNWERNDGNDVNLDRETAALARTQANYQLSASFAQKEIQKIYQLLRDGGR